MNEMRGRIFVVLGLVAVMVLGALGMAGLSYQMGFASGLSQAQPQPMVVYQAPAPAAPVAPVAPQPAYTYGAAPYRPSGFGFFNPLGGVFQCLVGLAVLLVVFRVFSRFAFGRGRGWGHRHGGWGRGGPGWHGGPSSRNGEWGDRNSDDATPEPRSV